MNNDENPKPIIGGPAEPLMSKGEFYEFCLNLNLQVPVASAASEAAEFSQCIASDDPRLRGK